jgi:TRAP-type C4-dicarboxylate transport system permease small subunit
MLDRLIGGATRASRWAAWAGGALMLITAVIVTFDVVVRKVAGFSLEGADELSGYTFAISTAWAFAFGLLLRSNVRIDGLYLMTPVPLRAALDIVALLALGLYVACLLYSSWFMWLDSYLYDARAITSWRTPLAWPQAAWLVGWLWFATVLVLLLARCVKAVLQKRPGDVVALAGLRTMEEEVREEVAHATDEVAHERQQRQSGG